MNFPAEINLCVPMLRRYARAALGCQIGGDAAVATVLRRFLEADCATTVAGLRAALYRELTRCLRDRSFSRQSPRDSLGPDPSLRARQAFLLISLAGFSIIETSELLETAVDDIASDLEHVQARLASQPSTSVLIIEDEFFISRDLATIVTSLGHTVLARARTHAEAMASLTHGRPGLILADVQLADGSSGVDAVTEIIAKSEAPVIFITAYPERLLTGLRAEPTFLVSKPYRVEEVKALIGQSLFFEDAARLVA